MNFPQKSQTNEKSILFWKLCWLLSLEDIWSTSNLRFVQVISVENGNLGNISQPRPDHLLVSIYVLSLKNVAWATNWFPLGSLISTIITWINLKLDIDNFFLRCRKHNHQTKIPDFPHFTLCNSMAIFLSNSFSSQHFYVILNCLLR